jgi:ATP-binding cassette subfamily B multidrug efflux pump
VRPTFRFLARYARRNLAQYALGGVMLLATNWAVVRIPALLGESLDVLESGGPAVLADARALAVELMVLAVVVIVVRTLSRVLFFNPGRDVEYRLGLDLFGHLLAMQRPFFVRRKIGELVSIASNDTASVRLLVGFAGLQICNVAVAIPLHLWQMWRTDPVLTAWCLLPVAIGAAYMRWTVKRFFAMVRDGMALLAKLSERVLESYAGIATIRAHAVEDAAMRRFDERNDTYLELQLRVSAIRAFGMPVLAFSGLAGAGIVLWVGGERVLGGALSVGHLATFMGLLVSLVSTLTSLAWVLASVSRGLVAVDRVADVLHSPDGLPPVTAPLDVVTPPRLGLRNLTFTHGDDDTPALQDITVDVAPGHTLGIFGKTGSGKTTLVNLLTRVHTPPAGTVFIDGLDITSVPLSAVRAAMAVVPQSPFLFSTRLRDNVTLPDGPTRRPKRGEAHVHEPTEPDPRLDDVLDAACLVEDIRNLPQGLDTIVGERGVMLSGGQRQRAALARALYRSRPVLVLDDVLSAVDQGTEVKMVSAIRRLKSGDHPPTTVIVSHRTSVLEHADEILVLEGGRIVERGTHDQLVAKGGVYAETHAHQAGAP